MSKFKVIVLALMLLLGIVFSVTEYGSRTFRSRELVKADYNNPVTSTLDLQPIKFTFERLDKVLNLWVPKAYLSDYRQSNGGGLSRTGKIEIEAALPSMLPLSVYAESLFLDMLAQQNDANKLLQSKDKNEDAFKAFRETYIQVIDRNRVLIYLYDGNGGNITSSSIGNIISQGVLDSAFKSELFSKKIDILNYEGLLFSFYFPRDIEQDIVIRCPPILPNYPRSSETRCELISDFQNGIGYSFWFSKYRLMEFSKLNTDVKKLINSWIKRPEQYANK